MPFASVLNPSALAVARPEAADLPLAIAFLGEAGVSPALLVAATCAARSAATSADVALLASGAVSEERFYRALARHLGLPYVERRVQLAADTPFPLAVHAGTARLAPNTDDIVVIVAPRGEALIALLRSPPPRGVAIIAPSRLETLVRLQARGRIAEEASLGLPSWDARLSARDGASSGQIRWSMLAAMLALGGTIAWPGPAVACATLFVGGLFLALSVLRLVASEASEAPAQPPPPVLPDADLPVYSVVVPLYDEGRDVVAGLVAALDALDYPASRLDLMLVLEAGDAATIRHVCDLALPSRYRLVLAPAGEPRTKPRALNLALPLARGSLLVVFDAEDVPEPHQLRLAAETFARAGPRLACLQARLAIDNVEDGWLARVFAVEYAALFDVVTPGLAVLGLPILLGGTSNHLRGTR